MPIYSVFQGLMVLYIYIYMDYQVYCCFLGVTNYVNDVCGSDYFKDTSPIVYIHGGIWDRDSSYYFVGGNATNMSISKIIITYINGKQKVLTKNMLRFNTSDDD